MTKLLLPIGEVPGVIRESLRSTLKAYGCELPEDVLHHAGNCAAQALYSIDENRRREAAEDNARIDAPDKIVMSVDDLEIRLDDLDDRDSDAPRLK